MTNKTIDEFQEYIYNIKSYDTVMMVTVQSNKNVNKYVIKQSYNENEICQEVLEPQNISGVKLIYKDNVLSIENTKLELKKIYCDYPYISENMLFLSDFISNYKIGIKEGTAKIKEENNNIIFLLNKRLNNYLLNEQLYFDKTTGKPSKLLIQDNNKKNIIYILYKEIELK